MACSSKCTMKLFQDLNFSNNYFRHSTNEFNFTFCLLYVLHSIHGAFKCQIWYFRCVPLKLSLLLDNGEAHSRTHFTAPKMLYSNFIFRIILNVNLTISSKCLHLLHVCVELSQTKIIGAVKKLYIQVNRMLIQD